MRDRFGPQIPTSHAFWCHYLIQQPCHLVKDAYYKLISASRGFSLPSLSPLSLAVGPHLNTEHVAPVPGHVLLMSPMFVCVRARLYDYIIFWFNAEAAPAAVAIFQKKKKNIYIYEKTPSCFHFCCPAVKVESCAGAFPHFPLLMCDIDASARCVSCFIVIIKACHLPSCSTCCLCLGPRPPIPPMMRASSSRRPQQVWHDTGDEPRIRDPIMIKNCSARAYLLRLAAIINEAESDCPGPWLIGG